MILGAMAPNHMSMLYERLLLIDGLMAPDGRYFCPLRLARKHIVRNLLNEIFGPKRFINEIVWHFYNKMQGNVNASRPTINNIFWFRKGR